MEYHDFETALKRLEEIVEKLEKEDLPLDEMLSLYEEGVKLRDYCKNYLEQAKGRIYKLTKSENNEAKIEEVSEDTLFKNDQKE
ncbi:MAG: exodeoxyribonuclease VII small subunit [Leptospiraceae bacterium]|nr:exodeoxyribonuclease VII small subunit [Leptospiraceae bacterium]MDW7976759.1 exodeoxyribonuclease VII small subunit [Leptospiraceae bacterium]